MWSVWLVFCNCGFHSVCPLMEKDKRLMEASCWERLTVEETGLVLMGGAVLSKTLIQFSVDGQGCVPSLLFDLRLNYGGGDEANGISFRRSCTRTAALSAPSPSAGRCWPTPPPETPGHSQTSLGQRHAAHKRDQTKGESKRALIKWLSARVTMSTSNTI